MWEYTDKVKDHFFNPRNVGRVKDPDGIGEVGSMETGDALGLTLKVNGDGVISKAKFQAFGCVGTIASSSVLTDMIKGKSLESAARITNKDIVDCLGGLPEKKMFCSVMAREALEAALENYRSGGTGKAAIKGKIVCKCFVVTDKLIERVIRENNLITVEEVTNYCKASGGCDSRSACRDKVEKIIEKIQGHKAKSATASVARNHRG